MKPYKKEGKVPVGLVSPDFIYGVAHILDHGNQKHRGSNWRDGVSLNQLLESLQRHTMAMQNGEDVDPETGKHHAYHIGAVAMIIAEGHKRGMHKNDDRLWGDNFRFARESGAMGQLGDPGPDAGTGAYKTFGGDSGAVPKS